MHRRPEEKNPESRVKQGNRQKPLEVKRGRVVRREKGARSEPPKKGWGGAPSGSDAVVTVTTSGFLLFFFFFELRGGVDLDWKLRKQIAWNWGFVNCLGQRWVMTDAAISTATFLLDAWSLPTPQCRQVDLAHVRAPLREAVPCPWANFVPAVGSTKPPRRFGPMPRSHMKHPLPRKD